MSTIKVDQILKRTGTGTITLGQNGDTIALGSGASQTLASNTPMFIASANVEFAVGTSLTKIIVAEVIDTDDAYDPSTGRFTVPSGKAGKYYFSFQGTHRSTANNQTGSGFAFYKNGSSNPYEFSNSNFSGHRNDTRMYNYIYDLSVGDYIEAYAYVTGSATTSIERPIFLGYKLIT